MNHVCIRIYPNGSAKYTVRDEAGMESWLSYNREARGGNSLFVDGVYVEGTGSLSGDELAHVARHVLATELPDPELRELSNMWDPDFREYRTRYPDDDDLVSDCEAEPFMGAIYERNNAAQRL